MNRVADDLLLQELERTEDYIHTCADAIDVKAGQILAAAAFLAVQQTATNGPELTATSGPRLLAKLRN
jgi:hypothetical protein